MRRFLFLAGASLVATAASATASWGQTAETVPAPVVVSAPEGAPAEEGTLPTEPESTFATVRVRVENVEPGRGNVWLALCDTSLSVEGCPAKKSVPASGEVVEVTFDDVAPGVYAVAGYQDLNGDDEFDKLLGVPREPYALSGPAGDMLMPTFEDAAMPLGIGENNVVLRMHGIGG